MFSKLKPRGNYKQFGVNDGNANKRKKGSSSSTVSKANSLNSITKKLKKFVYCGARANVETDDEFDVDEPDPVQNEPLEQPPTPSQNVNNDISPEIATSKDASGLKVIVKHAITGKEIVCIRDPSLESTVWKIFLKIFDDPTRAFCTRCCKTYSTGGGTTNLFEHLQRKHSIALQELAGETKNTQKTIDHMFQKSREKEIEPYSVNSSRKRDIDRAIAIMIALDFQPFSIVEDLGFRFLLHVLDPRYIPVSRKKLREELIPLFYDDITFKLLQILAVTDFVALAVDVWTSRSSLAYLAFTVHFIDENFQRKTYCLDVIELTEKETSENLAKEIHNVVNKWHLENKVVAITSDQGANIKKAITDAGFTHIPCFAHVLSTVLRNAVQCKVNKELQPGETLTEQQKELQDAEGKFDALIKKIQGIVGFFHKSSKATRLLMEFNGNRKLCQMIEIRWNTMKAMLESVYENNEFIKKVKLDPDYMENSNMKFLNENEMAEIAMLIRILSPFEYACKMVSGDYATVSVVIPSINGIMYQLNLLKTEIIAKEDTLSNPAANGKEKILLTPLAKVFLQRVLYFARLKFRIFEEKDCLILGSILDPRFKKESITNKSHYEEGKKFTIQEITKIVKSTEISGENSNRETINEPAEETSLAGGGGMDLFAYMSVNKSKESSISNASVAEATKIYDSFQVLPNNKSNVCPLQYWKTKTEYPILKKIVQKFFCVPGSSVSVERFFSNSGYIVTDRRSCLKGVNVIRLSSIGQNRNLLICKL